MIEVLVVISIIGILSVIVYASFGDARNSAKNRAFQVEMKETQLALALYKAQKGSYPPALDRGLAGCTGEPLVDGNGDVWGMGEVATTDACGSNAIIIPSLITEGYIPSLPDPSSSGNPDCVLQYQVIQALGYKLTAINCHVGETKEEGVPEDSEFSRCPSSSCTVCAEQTYSSFKETEDFFNSYAIYSNLGQCA